MTFVPNLDAINRTRAFGQGLAQVGLQAQPVLHPLQGLGQIAQAAMGGFLMSRANRQEQERREAGQQALLELLGGSTGAPTPGAPPGGGMTPTGATVSPRGVPGTPGPDTAALLQFAGQFPEMAGAVNPLIAQRLTPTKGVSVAPGGQLRDPVTGALIAEGAPKTEKLIEIADETSPTGTRFVPASEAINQPGRPRQEFRFETITDQNTGETRTIMVRGTGAGGAAAGEVSKPTRSKLEQSITTATTQLDRLAQIRENMDTRFLNLPEQFKQGGRALLERMGVELSPEARADLQAYTKFATSTRRNLNRILNELSGAAISPAEAKRLMAELPTTDDSPTQFMAKVADTEAAIRASIERNQQLLSEGVTSLKFDKDGNLTNAPGLENFMNMERGAVEATAPNFPDIRPGDLERRTIEAGVGATAPPGGFAATAVNPNTGEVVVWDGEKWIPQ